MLSKINRKLEMTYFVHTIPVLLFGLGFVGFVENTEIMKYVNRGDTVTLSCQRNSSLMTTRWRRNNEIISEGFKVNPLIRRYERYVIDNGKDFREYNLQIMNTTDIDQGNYVCEMQLQYNVIQTKYLVMLNKSSSSTVTDDVSTQPSLRTSSARIVQEITTNANEGMKPKNHLTLIISLCIGIPAGFCCTTILLVWIWTKRGKCNYKEVPTKEEYFTMNLESITCLEGTDCMFEIEVLDNNVSANWFKDDTVITLSNKYLTLCNSKRHRLVILNVDCEDAGEYSITIHNCSRRAMLTVTEYFTRTLKDLTCIEGTNCVFECEVIEECHSSNWLKDSIEITSSNKNTMLCNGKRHGLVISNVNIEDAGEYSIKINNRLRKAKLTVQEYFTRKLEGIRCVEETDCFFECEVLDDNVSANWFKDDIEITSSKKHLILSNGKKQSLVINNVDIEDAGEYSIKINNCLRKETLTVQEYFTRTLTDFKCREGTHCTFECEVLDDCASSYWLKDNRMITSSNKYKIICNGKRQGLEIYNVNIEDAGEYSIQIQNRLRKANLTVQEYFTSELKDLICIEGNDCIFECEVLDDSAQAHWFKDDIEITSSYKYKTLCNGKRQGLEIPNVDIEDAGEYSIKIDNCLRKAKLTVQEYFTKILEHTICIEVEVCLFKCEVLDDSATAHWSKNGTEIISSNKYEIQHNGKQHSLLVFDVNLNDAGQYRIQTIKCSRESKLTEQDFYLSSIYPSLSIIRNGIEDSLKGYASDEAEAHRFLEFIMGIFDNAIKSANTSDGTRKIIKTDTVPNNFFNKIWISIMQEVGLDLVPPQLDNPHNDKNDTSKTAVTLQKQTDIETFRASINLLKCIKDCNWTVLQVLLNNFSNDEKIDFLKMIENCIRKRCLQETDSRCATELYKSEKFVMKHMGFYRSKPNEPLTWRMSTNTVQFAFIMRHLFNIDLPTT